MANRQGTRWRGKLPIPAKAHPLVRQLFELMNARRLTVTEVAERAGSQPATISNWRYRNSPQLVEIEAALGAVGFELTISPKETSGSVFAPSRVRVSRTRAQAVAREHLAYCLHNGMTVAQICAGIGQPHLRAKPFDTIINVLADLWLGMQEDSVRRAA